MFSSRFEVSERLFYILLLREYSRFQSLKRYLIEEDPVSYQIGDRGARSCSFGRFVLYPDLKVLLDGQKPLRVGARALNILCALVERPGEIVSKRELLERVWPGVLVDEANLKVNVAALRRLLTPSSNAERYIATASGRGYRFIAPVHFIHGPPGNGQGGSSSPEHNLPVAKTRLVGRSEALASLAGCLTKSRLVTIVGPGGVGKTTAALAIAEREVDNNRDGVWLVDLATVETDEQVFDAIAHAVGLVSNSANVLATITSGLRERKMLIVLDNCEHVVRSAATFARQIVDGTSYVTILATSREPLKVDNEFVYRLPSLDVPESVDSLSAADAAGYSAIELFVDRASDRTSAFRLSDENAPHVAEICRRLDGLALAIELAATRTDAFEARELLGLLDDRFQLLKAPRGVHPRHQTLLSIIDWSYQLLSDRERAVMRRLSVFASSFSAAAANSVVTDALERHSVTALLESLVAKSLISFEVKNGVPRYRQLETTRRYAANKLVEARELELTRLRHAEYVLEIAMRARSEYADASAATWSAWHRDELPDLRSALSWCFRQPQNRALGVKLTMAGLVYWEEFSLVEECRSAVERALKDEHRPCRTDREELILRLTLGATLLHTRGPLPEIKVIWTRALEQAEILGENALWMECLNALWEYAIWTGDTISAVGLAERLKLFRSDDSLAAQMFSNGTALRYMGELGGARLHLESMINRPATSRKVFDIPRFGVDQRLNARGSLALVLWMQGYPDEGWEVARLQRKEAELANHPVSYCSALIHTSCPLALYTGDFEFADQLLHRIDAIASEHGLTVWRAMATCLRANWLLDHGNKDGLALFQEALSELHRGGFRMRYPAYLCAYGQGLAEHGDIDAAHITIDESIRLSLESGQTWSIPELLRVKGHAYRAEGTLRASRLAAEKYMESIEWARRQGGRSWELRSATSLAELWQQTGVGGPARAILADVYHYVTGGDWTQDKRAARAILEANTA